jgi:hypothetical protein
VRRIAKLSKQFAFIAAVIGVISVTSFTMAAQASDGLDFLAHDDLNVTAAELAASGGKIAVSLVSGLDHPVNVGFVVSAVTCSSTPAPTGFSASAETIEISPASVRSALVTVVTPKAGTDQLMWCADISAIPTSTTTGSIAPGPAHRRLVVTLAPAPAAVAPTIGISEGTPFTKSVVLNRPNDVGALSILGAILLGALVIAACLGYWNAEHPGAWLLGALCLVGLGIAFLIWANTDRSVSTIRTALTPPATTPLTFVGADGELRAATWANHQILFDAPFVKTGAFTAAVDLTPGDDQPTMTTLTVNVRQSGLWAALTLLLGIGVAAGLQQWFTNTRAKRVANVRAAQVRGDVAIADVTWEGARNWMASTVLATRLDELDALSNADPSKVADAAAALKLLLSRVVAARGHLSDLEVALRKITAADAATRLLGLCEITADLIAPPANGDELDAKLTAIETWHTSLATLGKYADRVLQAPPDELSKVAGANTGTELSQAIGVALSKSPKVTVEIALQDGLPPAVVTENVTVIPPAVDRRPVVGDAYRLAFTTEAAGVFTFSDGVSLSGPFTEPIGTYVEYPVLATGRDQTIAVLRDSVLVANAEIPAAAPALEVRLAERLRHTDWVVFSVGALLAVASGLTTLYVGKTTWGAWADYLAALTWGSTVAGGFAVVANLIKRALPAAP